MPRTDIEQLHTVPEVMDVLRVGRATVYRLVDAGELELVQVAKRKGRITDRSLKEFLRKITKSKQEEQP